MSCITLPNVLHVPNMRKNLISVSHLTKDHDLVAEFDSYTCVIKDKNTGLVLLRGQLKDGLYQLNSTVASVDFRLSAHSFSPKSLVRSTSPFTCTRFSFPNYKQSTSSNLGLSSTVNVNVAQTNHACKQWHAKLRHPSLSVLQLVLNKIQVPFSLSSLSFCDSCKIGKLHQLPFSDCEITAIKPLELVYSNLWGPSPTLSTKGYRYYIVFVDAYTRYT